MINAAEIVVVAGVLAALGLPRLWSRLRLSRAKHPSLAGHSRMAKRVAALVPGYSFDGPGFFRADGAPEEIAQRRETAFGLMAKRLRQQYPKGLALTDAAMPLLSDLQLTAAYRVPFPFSKRVREELPSAPFAVASRGNRLLDADGNEVIDLTGSYGVNLFGNDFYKATIEAGLARTQALGTVLGYYHPIVIENARRIAALAGQDEVSFHMSGTEAVMQAVRLARHHTRRTRVVRFCGAYHGWWGDVQPGPGNPMAADATYTLRDMDERSLQVLATRKDIACVLVNPLQALHPNSPAPADSGLVAAGRRATFERAAYTRWLQQLREVCTKRGIPLIFDEVFVGFRLAKGGAQEYFGVRADLVTYGKTLGGGLPVGVVCGQRRFMRRFDDAHPADLCFARGTFNAHPAVMGTMSAFLDALDQPATAALYRQLDERWAERAGRLNAQLAAACLPVHIAALGTIWTVLYAKPSRYNWMFQYYLRRAGLALSWVGSGRLIFSLDFTDEDFNEVCARFQGAAHDMLADGWWWTPAAATNAQVGRRVLHEMLQASWHRRRRERAGQS